MSDRDKYAQVGTSQGHGQRWLSLMKRSGSGIALAAGAVLVLLLGLNGD